MSDRELLNALFARPIGELEAERLEREGDDLRLIERSELLRAEDKNLHNISAILAELEVKCT